MEEGIERQAKIQEWIANTPARVFVGRSGPAYRTATSLQLREDHAAARDAVQTEIDLHGSFDAEFVERHSLFETMTAASSKAEYLRRPDLGRKLNLPSRERVLAQCQKSTEFQVILGDGLSSLATAVQSPRLLDGLQAAVAAKCWTWGRPFLVKYCRVGVLNEVGDLLQPQVLVLLVGERPGLATAESLSAYMAFQPRSGHTDANRNLISNIHVNGVAIDDAVRRILSLADQYRSLGRSGVGITEIAAPRTQVGKIEDK